MLELTTITDARMLCDAKNITAVIVVGNQIRVYFGFQGWSVDVVDDPDRVLDARRRALRDERVERFALALVGTDWRYNPEARDFTSDMVWQWAEKLADAEPSSNH